MVQTLVEEDWPRKRPRKLVRTAERQGYRNGSYRRDLVTRYGPIDDLRVPRVQLTDGSAPQAYQNPRSVGAPHISRVRDFPGGRQISQTDLSQCSESWRWVWR